MTVEVLKFIMLLKMLRNVPISELIKVLVSLQKESNLCNIEINEEGNGGIMFRAVRDTNATTSKAKIQTPKDPNPKLDLDDLDKLIV